jgi:hypothetical protein
VLSDGSGKGGLVLLTSLFMSMAAFALVPEDPEILEGSRSITCEGQRAC